MLNILKVAHMYFVKIFISLLLHARYWIYIGVKSMWSLLSFSLYSGREHFIYLLNICCIRLASAYSDNEERQSPEFKKYMFTLEALKSKQIHL